MKTPPRCTFAASLALIAALSFLAPPSAEAQINYQGILTDDTGNPLPDGQTTIAFSLWDAATGGTKVWGDHVLDGGGDDGHGPRADVVNGRFNVIIGNLDVNGASLTTSMDTDDTLFLQIQVAGDPAITPRQAILAAPRALMADRVRDEAVTKASLIKEVADALCPPGSIIAFGGTTVPDGWLLCDGTALKSTNYGRLSSAIGTAWGDGGNDADPETDFNLPDLRGLFLRGVNGTRDDGFKASETVTYNINNANVSSDSVADLTIDAPEPFPETLILTIAGLAPSPAAIPDGEYTATRIDATTWRISGGAGFTVGNHTGLTGTATGSGRRVGSFQSENLHTHRHQWGYRDSIADLWTWDVAGNGAMALNRAASNQIPGGSGKDDDYMDVMSVAGGFWTEPVPPLESPGSETRPNNAAVHYIIKY